MSDNIKIQMLEKNLGIDARLLLLKSIPFNRIKTLV